jgi:Raf kinase inhibitor-like YbhB/YbcL family protein
MAPQPAPVSPAPQPRRAIQSMTLESPAWPDGGVIPARYTQPGRDVSPALRWSGAPEGVVSFVLVARDLDAVSGPAAEDALHWLVWNIPGTATGLPEGVAPGNAPAAPQPFGPGPPPPPKDGPRQISATGPAYRGPAAPASGPAHHYVFEVYALDAWIDVAAVGQSPSATRAAVTAALAGHVRAKGVFTGRYRRPAP